ncbi:hypothetical protein D9611_011840 [Ephemerocybe angulata]|uniref:Uncharacterized protein n=1 Tax=Ephemerocybe angulata TaxID=980116 RepID=A0A8H5BY01_9AGAR|nr:hypothetical protein D9611_011840 [Tulosesus angulatus]
MKWFKRKHMMKDLFSNPRTLRCLRSACERAKCTLSSATQSPIKIDPPFSGGSTSTPPSLVPVSRSSAKIFSEAHSSPSRRFSLVSEFFNGKEPKKSINPDEVAADGWTGRYSLPSKLKEDPVSPPPRCRLSPPVASSSGVPP